MKIRLWGTDGECRLAVERLMRTPGLLVLSVSGPHADRGASALVRVYVEARLAEPAEGASQPSSREVVRHDVGGWISGPSIGGPS